MLRKTIGLIILLLIMLNHAVVACDAMVVHMPDHAHAYTSLTDTHPNDIQNNEHSSTSDAEQHSAHAHVSCHIAFFHGVELLNFNSSAISCANPSCQTISYSPPVPPPNV